MADAAHGGGSGGSLSKFVGIAALIVLVWFLLTSTTCTFNPSQRGSAPQEFRSISTWGGSRSVSKPSESEARRLFGTEYGRDYHFSVEEDDSGPRTRGCTQVDSEVSGGYTYKRWVCP